ncbi:cell division protein ZapA [Clostridium omnivorum]|uniref:Cell division protein ZapA n=1 Tax=Clostridium omnivorum TaxID=1604902 RepID=A0ABQ5N0J8_9CLOT|nr:cell division protein ZapA [Clostridium sp. E14]GLC28707.1 cell division protein ZapA [Clostridium sp. E14]
MNVVTVNINGIDYHLKGEEKEEYLQRVANYVDKKINHFMEGNNKLSTTSAAVLTALNAVDELFKCYEEFEKLDKELEALEKSEGNYKKETAELMKQLAESEQKNKELDERLIKASNNDLLREKDLEIERLNGELEKIKQTEALSLDEKNKLKSENKDLKFQLQSTKYKLIDLQHKLIDNQIDLVKAKKSLENSLLSED